MTLCCLCSRFNAKVHYSKLHCTPFNYDRRGYNYNNNYYYYYYYHNKTYGRRYKHQQ